MSKQSKRYSALEALANIVIGSFTLQLGLYPILGIPVTINQNIIIILVFFLASFIRGYLIRRIFNKF